MKAKLNRYQQAFQVDKKNSNEKHREDLILKYAPLVKFITERMAIRLPPNISKEELTSAGTLGLLDALDKFDPEKGVKFQTYAEHRIRGAMIDELRKLDWVPRSIRKEIHKIEDAMIACQSRLGRKPDDFEVAQEMGIDIHSYHKIINRSQGISLLSFDTVMTDSPIPQFSKQDLDALSPFDEYKKKELKKTISRALSKLSKKEQTVMSLYYYEQLTLKEIAKVMDLTESRISQIHSKAIIILRAKLKGSSFDI